MQLCEEVQCFIISYTVLSSTDLYIGRDDIRSLIIIMKPSMPNKVPGGKIPFICRFDDLCWPILTR